MFFEFKPQYFPKNFHAKKDIEKLENELKEMENLENEFKEMENLGFKGVKINKLSDYKEIDNLNQKINDLTIQNDKNKKEFSDLQEKVNKKEATEEDLIKMKEKMTETFGELVDAQNKKSELEKIINKKTNAKLVGKKDPIVNEQNNENISTFKFKNYEEEINSKDEINDKLKGLKKYEELYNGENKEIEIKKQKRHNTIRIKIRMISTRDRSILEKRDEFFIYTNDEEERISIKTKHQHIGIYFSSLDIVSDKRYNPFEKEGVNYKKDYNKATDCIEECGEMGIYLGY